MTEIKVGDKVRLVKNIFEPASEDAPAGFLAYRNDIVIIKGIKFGVPYPFFVAHEGVDGCFGVSISEISADL